MTTTLRLTALALLVTLAGCSNDPSKKSPSENTNNPPAFTGPTTVDFPEQRPFSLVLSAADDEDDTLTYEISGGDDAALFMLNSLTGELTAATPFDFEQPEDANGDGMYELIVSVADEFNGAVESTLTVRITDREILEPQMLFPSSNAQAGGVASITVAGRVIDSEALEPSSVVFHEGTVDINGVEAVFSTEDPHLWRARVPLALGENELRLTFTASSGDAQTVDYTIKNEPVIVDATSVALDEDDGTLYIADGASQAIFSYHPDSGVTAFVADVLATDATIGTPRSLHLDKANSRLIFLDIDSGSIKETSLSTGEVNIIAGSSVGTGPNFVQSQAMAVSNALNRAFILDQVGVVKVDLTSGAREYLLEFSAQDQLPGFSSLVLDEQYSRLLAVPSHTSFSSVDDGIYGVDMTTGSVASIVSNAGADSGVRIVAANSGKAWLLSYSRLWEVDLMTGERRVLIDHFAQPSLAGSIALSPEMRALYEEHADRLVLFDETRAGFAYFSLIDDELTSQVSLQATVGAGPEIGRFATAGFDLASMRALIVDSRFGAVLTVDLTTGGRELQFNDDLLIANPYKTWESARYSKKTDRLYFLDLTPRSDGGLIFQADLSANVAEVAYSTNMLRQHTGGSEHGFILAPSLAVDDENHRLLFSATDGGTPFVSWLDLDTGSVSSLWQGEPESWNYIHLSNLDLENQRVLTATRLGASRTDIALGALDLSAGEARPINETLTRNSIVSSISTLSLFDDGSTAVVATPKQSALLWVNPASGEHRTLSGPQKGVGPAIGRAANIALDEGNQRAFLQVHESIMMVDMVSGDRVILSN